jgi:hypothetical protein
MDQERLAELLLAKLLLDGPQRPLLDRLAVALRIAVGMQAARAAQAVGGRHHLLERFQPSLRFGSGNLPHLACDRGEFEELDAVGGEIERRWNRLAGERGERARGFLLGLLCERFDRKRACQPDRLAREIQHLRDHRAARGSAAIGHQDLEAATGHGLLQGEHLSTGRVNRYDDLAKQPLEAADQSGPWGPRT